MIIRILAEGQYEVDDTDLERLNELDTVVQNAVDSDDDARFSPALAALLDAVRSVAKPLPDDALTESQLILPAADMDLRQVRGMLGDEGLIPG